MSICWQCGRVDGQHGTDCERINAARELHLQSIIDYLSKDLERKYRAGQREHGGNLWEKPGMLNHAIDEVVDLVVYLYTLRAQLERLNGPAEE